MPAGEFHRALDGGARALQIQPRHEIAFVEWSQLWSQFIRVWASPPQYPPCCDCANACRCTAADPLRRTRNSLCSCLRQRLVRVPARPGTGVCGAKHQKITARWRDPGGKRSLELNPIMGSAIDPRAYLLPVFSASLRYGMCRNARSPEQFGL
jgi:hypothetical protein